MLKHNISHCYSPDSCSVLPIFMGIDGINSVCICHGKGINSRSRGFIVLNWSVGENRWQTHDFFSDITIGKTKSCPLLVPDRVPKE